MNVWFRMFICSICNLFRGNTYAAVLRHIGEIHRHDPALHIRCGIHRCPQTYGNYESFRSHVYRKHRDALHQQPTTSSACDDLPSDNEDGDDYSELGPSQPDIKNGGAKFLLKTRDQNRVPQSTLNTIISDLKGLWTLSMESVKDKVQKCLQSNDELSLMDCFDDSFPLDGLQTEYQQLHYYKEHFNYLVSLTMPIIQYRLLWGQPLIVLVSL